MGECPPSESQAVPPFNPNPKTLTWERLETMRLQKLGLPNRYSRHFNVLRAPQQSQAKSTLEPETDKYGIPSSNLMSSSAVTDPIDKSQVTGMSNSLAPFATLVKPTCGYFFSRTTDNRKRKFGIPASDLVKWRCSSNH